MKKIILSILLLAVAGFSIFSFKKFPNKCLKADFSTIINKEYVYVDNGAETDITLTFSDDGRVFGFSGVNRYFAGYKLENDNKLELSPIGSTMMAGPAEKMDLERNYLNLLSMVNKIKVCKNKITLVLNNNQLLKFVKSNEEFTNQEITQDDANSEVMGPEIEITENTDAVAPEK